MKLGSFCPTFAVGQVWFFGYFLSLADLLLSDLNQPETVSTVLSYAPEIVEHPPSRNAAKRSSMVMRRLRFMVDPLLKFL